MRQSIAPTYNRPDTGDRFHVTTGVNDRTDSFQQPMPDPFHNTIVRVRRLDLLRSLVRGHLDVFVVVGGDREIVEDVLELDADYRGLTDSTRRTECDADLHAALATFAGNLDADDFSTQMAAMPPTARRVPAEPGVDMSRPDDHGIVRRLP